jgi:hypothetical protein
MLRKKVNARPRVLTHSEDVDGVVCAAIILKRYPKAIIRTAKPSTRLIGRYDLVVDLPLQRSLTTSVWVDHHATGDEGGTCAVRVHDPGARSAAGILARHLGIKAEELVGIADRADSAKYRTPPPIGLKARGYDPAWEVNDAIKATHSRKRFVELAKVLAFGSIEELKKEFNAEISHTREARRGAEKTLKWILKLVEKRKPDSMIILMPPSESSTESGHLVFSLYPKGIKAFAVFYEKGCWLSVAKGFDGLDASKLARRYGGGGHQKSAGARIGANRLGEIKREFELAGLSTLVVDLRGKKPRAALR